MNSAEGNEVIGPHDSCLAPGACCSNPCDGPVFYPDSVDSPGEANAGTPEAQPPKTKKPGTIRTIGRKILSSLA